MHKQDSAQKPVGIVGLGLVGGSLAKALSAQGRTVLAVDPDPSTRKHALEQHAVTQIFANICPELNPCETIFIAVPLGALDIVLQELATSLEQTVLVSDVIGVKSSVAQAAERILPHHRFVGCHPMAGGELGGYAHARADLFGGKTVAICGQGEDAQALSQLWQSVQALPVQTTPEAHDRAVAATSHVPYLSALALVRLAESFEHDAHIAGKGFFDATRRADFQPEVMASVVGQNPFVPSALRAQAHELLRLANMIEQDPGALLTEAHQVRALRQR